MIDIYVECSKLLTFSFFIQTFSVILLFGWSKYIFIIILSYSLQKKIIMKKISLIIALFISLAVHAQSPFIGEIRIFAGNFAPRGWAFCDGQLLPLSQNTALFSLLGTIYGGNGHSTFALPNLNGRVPIGAGQGAGLTSRDLGGTGGSDNVTLLASELPSHQHSVVTSGTVTLPANSGAGNSDTPENTYPANVTNGYSATAGSSMNTSNYSINLSNTGASMPHNNLQPYQVVRYIIALQGIFPPRW